MKENSLLGLAPPRTRIATLDPTFALLTLLKPVSH